LIQGQRPFGAKKARQAKLVSDPISIKTEKRTEPRSDGIGTGLWIF
jgi:hypothetical protein